MSLMIIRGIVMRKVINFPHSLPCELTRCFSTFFVRCFFFGGFFSFFSALSFQYTKRNEFFNRKICTWSDKMKTENYWAERVENLRKLLSSLNFYFSSNQRRNWARTWEEKYLKWKQKNLMQTSFWSCWKIKCCCNEFKSFLYEHKSLIKYCRMFFVSQWFVTQIMLKLQLRRKVSGGMWRASIILLRS